MTIFGDVFSGDDNGLKELTPEELIRQTKRMEERFLLGDMDRLAFERAIFIRPIDSWPVGHLRDHRVSIPPCLATICLSLDETELAALLGRFLCEAPLHKTARQMISEALRIDPATDARSLIQIRAADPLIFSALLRGHIGEIWTLLKRTPASVRWTDAKAAMRLMLLYYGALELQLIAARNRNFDLFYAQLGLKGGDGGPTVGGFLSYFEEVVAAGVYAEQAADEHRPAGRIPKIIADHEKEGRAFLAHYGIAETPGSFPPKLLEFLRAYLAELQISGTPEVAAWRSTPSAANLNKPGNKSFRPVDARLELRTLFGSMTPGEQIGFACLRLANLAFHMPQLLFENGVEMKHLSSWNNGPFAESASECSHVLFFVHQAVTIGDPQTCLPNTALRDLENRYSLWRHNRDGSIRQNATLKKIAPKQGRKLKRIPLNAALAKFVSGQGNSLTGRPTIGAGDALDGLALFDVLPDYRLGIKPMLLPGTASQTSAKKRNEPPSYYKKHGIYE